MEQTEDGHYILGGYSRSGISGDKVEATRDNLEEYSPKGDYWVVKLSATGALLWNKTIGGAHHDVLASIRQTRDQGYILGGYSNSDLSGEKMKAGKGSYDFWVVKLDSTQSARKTQNITFAPLPDVNFSAQKTFTLAATASSGLPVSYQILAGPATLKNNQVTFRRLPASVKNLSGELLPWSCRATRTAPAKPPLANLTFRLWYLLPMGVTYWVALLILKKATIKVPTTGVRLPEPCV